MDPAAAAVWRRPLADVLEDPKCARLRVRWEALARDVKVHVMQGWGGDDKDAQAWLEAAVMCGDFAGVALGTTHGVRLRVAAAVDAAFTGGILQPYDDYVILYPEGAYFKIRKMDDGVEGFIARKNSIKQKKVKHVNKSGGSALSAPLCEQKFEIDSLTTWPLPAALRSLLLTRVSLIDLDGQWIKGQAFKRDISKEGRMCNYGARSGREIIDEACAVPLHPLTEHILRLLNYPLPDQAEPWRHINVVWNKYTPGCGTALHTNWIATKRVVYLHFGATPESSCRFSFFQKGGRGVWRGVGAEVQSQRIHSTIMALGSAVDQRYLHSVTDVRGTHYSMVIREISDDWKEWRDWKLHMDGPDDAHDSGDEEAYMKEEMMHMRKKRKFNDAMLNVPADGKYAFDATP